MIARDCCCRSGIISASEGLGLVLLGVLGFGNEEISCGLGVGLGSTGALATAVLGADWPAMLAESEPARLIFLPTAIALGLSDGFAAWRAATLVPWRRAMLLSVSPDAIV